MIYRILTNSDAVLYLENELKEEILFDNNASDENHSMMISGVTYTFSYHKPNKLWWIYARGKTSWIESGSYYDL